MAGLIEIPIRTSLSATLPQNAPVHVIKEDLKNPNLLFVGTERGMLASVSGGMSWHRLMNGLPTVPVRDLVIHPRDNDLIAGTHGRGIWILDDISPLQQLLSEVLGSDVFMFDNVVATKWYGVSRGATRGHFLFQGRNPLTIQPSPPRNNASDLANSAAVHFYLKVAPSGPVTIEVSSLDGEQSFTEDFTARQGINRYFWRLRMTPEGGPAATAGRGGRGGGRGGRGFRPPPVAAGTYRVRLTVDGRIYEGSVAVREDPDIG